MKINFQMTAIALLGVVVFFFWTEGAINLIWLCHGTDTEFYGHSEWYLTYFFLFVIVWMDGVFWGGGSYSVFWQQFRVMCVLITQHLQSWCAKVPWSWLVVSGRNATRSELWTDRQTDADLWHHPFCLSGSIIMFIRGMYFWKIFHIIQIARIRRCQEFPYMLAAEYSIGACEWGGSWPCMRVCFGGKIEQFEIQSVALTESSKL